MFSKIIEFVSKNETKKVDLLNKHKSRHLTIMEYENDLEQSSIFKEMKSSNSFKLLTNFSENQLLSFLNRIQTYCIEATRRGPKTHLNWVDSCIILLVYYKSYWEIDKIAIVLKKSSYVIKTVIAKYREIFNKFLKNEWIEKKQRPLKNDTKFQYVGLNFDHTSIEIYKPHLEFNSAKRFYDGKNKIYALKKGVAILPTLGYAVFIFNSINGSVSDYQDFKENYIQLAEYLRKTENERITSRSIDDHISWYITVDKGYIGDEIVDTPGIRKLIPFKTPQGITENQHNNDVYSIHLIERFFGRMKSLWKITSSVYRNDKNSFNLDIDNCILLTNEHIRLFNLIDDDRLYYQAFIISEKQQKEEKSNKRKIQYENYRAKKREKLLEEMERS